MLTIISKEKIDDIHQIEAQSHRTEVWLDGYVSIPQYLVDLAWETCGYCDLVFDAEGNLADIIPTEKPVIPEPEEPMSEMDELAKAIKEGVNSI